MKEHCRQIAQRIVDAENSFAEIVMYVTDCDEETAHQVTAFYLKHRLAKRIGVDRISVTHGAYLERDVLERAIRMVRGAS
jgi:hypothetical protein